MYYVRICIHELHFGPLGNTNSGHFHMQKYILPMLSDQEFDQFTNLSLLLFKYGMAKPSLNSKVVFISDIRGMTTTVFYRIQMRLSFILMT